MKSHWLGVYMQRKSLLVFVLAMLLPYGFALVDTATMIVLQFWMFPIGIYIQGLVSWFNLGIFIPFFILPAQPFTLSLGILWLALGLYISRYLQHVHDGQKDVESLYGLTLRLLVLQVIATVVVSFIAWYGWLIIVVPLPLHFLVVLYLTRLHIQRDMDTQL